MALQIRQVEQDDLSEISRLIARVFSRPAPADGAARLRWLLFDNPDATERIPKGWVLVDDDRPVGFLANVARRMIVGGEDVLLACTAHFVVLATHRFQGLLLAKAFFDQSDVDGLFCASGSEESIPVLRRFGAQPIPGGDDAAAFVLKAGPVVEELLRRRGWSEGLARVAATGAGPAVSMLERVRCHLPKCPADLRLETMTRFDSAVDRLWGRCRCDYSITSRRDSTRLNWLFVDGPASRPRTLILGAFRDAELVGYIVCQDRGRTEALRRRHVMDVFTPRDEPQVFDALVGAAGRRTRSDGLDTLEFRSIPERYLGRLALWGARRRRLDVNPFLMHVPKGASPVPAAGCPTSYLVPSDGDGAGW